MRRQIPLKQDMDAVTGKLRGFLFLMRMHEQQITQITVYDTKDY